MYRPKTFTSIGITIIIMIIDATMTPSKELHVPENDQGCNEALGPDPTQCEASSRPS